MCRNGKRANSSGQLWRLQYTLNNISSYFNSPNTDGDSAWCNHVCNINNSWSKCPCSEILWSSNGRFTIVILIQLFAKSIIMVSLGIIGYYMAKMYEEIKGRLRYIIRERTHRKYTNETATD